MHVFFVDISHLLWTKCCHLAYLPLKEFRETALFNQGWKIALVRSYLRVPQAAGQVKILAFLVKFKIFPIYANNF